MNDDIIIENGDKPLPSGPPPAAPPPFEFRAPNLEGFVPLGDIQRDEFPKEPSQEDLREEEPAKKRGRGRPPGSKNKKEGEEIPEKEVIPVDYDGLAGQCFDISSGLMTMAVGPEWQPESPDERTAVVKPLAIYMESKGVSDIPPGVLLAIVITGYAAKRVRHPNTSAKIVLLWKWIKSKIFRQ